MSRLDDALVAALHAKADDAAQSVDPGRARAAVEARLDRVDRRRRRRVLLIPVSVGVAAAAVAVIVFAGRDLPQAGPLPPTQPSPTSTPTPSVTHPLSIHLLAGSPGQYGFAEGNGAMARFDSIGGLAVGPTGTIYVSDFSSTLHRSVVRAITPAGHVTTIADEPTTQDAFGALAVDARGTVYVAVGHEIRRIGRNGQMFTVAGATPSTSFGSILGMVVSPDYGLDVTGAGSVREVNTHDGTVLTLPDCSCRPGAIAVAPLLDTIYIGADDYKIRMIYRHTTVSIMATGAANVLFSRMSLAVDPHSVLWAMDTAGLHTVAPDGTVSTVPLTGSPPGQPLSGIAIGANGAIYAIDEQSAIVTLRPSG